MVSLTELKERIKEFYGFSKQELSGMISAILILAFIFTFNDWGETTFELITGLTNLILLIIIATITLFFRISLQKFYGLGEGQKVEFKVWWLGLMISLLLIFLTFGRLPIILVGGVVTAMMIKQRLGERRYGHSYGIMAVIGLWGVIANLLLATIFAIGFYYSPQNYFFYKGLILNIIMAICSLLPLPQLDGLKMFFGSRVLYLSAIIITLLISSLLLIRSKIALIIVITIEIIGGIVNYLTMSDI